MNEKKHMMRAGIIMITVLVLAGLAFMYTGNDAVAQAVQKKEGILTAEQVKVSFDSVSGRLVKEAVKEADLVKKGDVLMVLDSTDTDLSIQKLKAQIAQLDAQIKSAENGVALGYSKIDNDEIQSRRSVDIQREAVEAARATYDNVKLEYGRRVELRKQDCDFPIGTGRLSRRTWTWPGRTF